MDNTKKPPVGAIGSFTVSPPYDAIIDPIKEYKVEAIRSIQDMIDGNENPLQVVYLDNGLTEDDMKTDVHNDVFIVVLTDSANNYAYVPETKFLSSPDVTGIRYQEKVLGFNLGVIELDYDLTPLIEDIKSVIQERIGVISNSKVIDASAILRIPKDKHNLIKSSRDALIKVNPGYYYKYKECLEQTTLLKKSNSKLAKVLTNYLSSDLVEIGYRFNKALNLNNVLKDFKYRLHTDMKINNNLFVELSINEYCIYDDNAKYIRIVKYNNSSVSYVNQVSLDIIYDRLGIYTIGDKIIVTYINNNTMYYKLYSLNLDEVSSGEIYSNITNEYNILPVQYSDDMLIIGVTDNTKSYIRKIIYNNSITIENIEIDNILTSNSPLDLNSVFSIAISTNNGIIGYKNNFCKIDVDLLNNTAVKNSVFSNINLSNIITYYISTVTDKFIILYKDINGKLAISEININYVQEKPSIITDIDYDIISITQTVDRSLLITYNDTDSSITIKKYI